MRWRTAFRSVLLDALLTVLFSPLVHAQLPPHLERCLPYPPPDDETETAEPTVAFNRIIFENNRALSGSVRRLLLKATRDHTFWLYPGWTDELAEVGLRGTLQEHGYFRAEASAKAEILSKDAKHDHVALTIRVNPGRQYRLGSVQFRSVDPDAPLGFPPQELRKQLPMRTGEIFDTNKLRESFDALKRLYGSSGWIDFTPMPKFDVNDAAKRINLVVEIDPEVQYRIGEIDFLGDNPVPEKIARSMFKPGEPFNNDRLRQFYIQNASILPAYESPQDMNLTKDVKRGVVNLRFDFRTCPASWE